MCKVTVRKGDLSMQEEHGFPVKKKKYVRRSHSDTSHTKARFYFTFKINLRKTYALNAFFFVDARTPTNAIALKNELMKK